MLERPTNNPPMIRDSIVTALQHAAIPFELLTHEPVFTMEGAQAATGEKPEEGVKCLLLKGYKTKHDSDFVLAVWRGDRRVDTHTLASTLGYKKVSMASPEEVQKTLGIEIGALAPLGYSISLPVIFDQAILENEFAYINPGRHDETIKLKAADLRTAIAAWQTQTQATITEFTSH
jgi:prolyl-tRNA editing enzyme YbaK/EbsC (Cys-tRNA(Pro) deacylase)